MKLEDFFDDTVSVGILNEALLDNKRLMTQLKEKWGDQITGDTQDKQSLFYQIVDWFDRSKGNLKPTITRVYTDPVDNEKKTVERPNPPISKFTTRYKNFNVDDLSDISKYTAEQILFLYNEINEISKGIELDVFTTVPEKNKDNPAKFDLKSTDTKRIASKALWDNSKGNAIINEGPVRVYRVNNQQEAVNFGFYLQSTYPKRQYNHLNEGEQNFPYLGLSGSQWCVTNNDTSTNLYFNYRTNRTFYFLIDDSKHPDVLRERNEENQTIGQFHKSTFYLCAIQKLDNGGFQYTPIQNGNYDTTENFLVSVYPQLAGKMDKIIHVPMVTRENEAIDKGNTKIALTEAEVGPPNEFAFADFEAQQYYITILNGPLSKAKSWSHINFDLRKRYINQTMPNTIQERFGSYELLTEIEKSDKDTNTFNYRMSQIQGGKTLAEMLGKSLRESGQFDIWKVSVENPSLELWRDGNNRYGIFDTSKQGHSFFKKNNITYNPNYVLSEELYYMDEQGKEYWVEYFTLFHKDNRENLKAHFYLATDVDKMREKKAHFYSYDDFQKMKEEFFVEDLPQGQGTVVQQMKKGDIE